MQRLVDCFVRTMALDPVVFQYTLLPNRVENFPDNLSAPPLLKYRLQSVTSEAGNVVSVYRLTGEQISLAPRTP